MEDKILFVTGNDIFDEYGNGGVKGSKKNYDLLVNKFGKNSVIVLQFALSTYKHNTDLGSNLICFQSPDGNLQALIAACGGCKKYFPWEEAKILKCINSLNVQYVFFDGTTIGKLVKRKTQYRQIVFFHNIEADYALNKVKNESFLFLPSYMASLYNEKMAICADKICCLNERDAKLIKDRYGRAADCLLPVSFADSFEKEKTRINDDEKILFVGSYFGPNVDGVEWFIKNVMISLEEVELNIVGKGFECKKIEYEKYGNVNVIGTVDDLSEYYYSHDIVVMPIRYGAGMKVKTAEAMMYGRTIIASDEALEGYDVDGVDGICRCNSAEEYIRTIKAELVKIHKPYNESVRKLFLDKYETANLFKTIDRLFAL